MNMNDMQNDMISINEGLQFSKHRLTKLSVITINGVDHFLEKELVGYLHISKVQLSQKLRKLCVIKKIDLKVIKLLRKNKCITKFVNVLNAVIINETLINFIKERNPEFNYSSRPFVPEEAMTDTSESEISEMLIDHQEQGRKQQINNIIEELPKDHMKIILQFLCQKKNRNEIIQVLNYLK